MKENEITLNDIYNFTRVLLNANVNKEVWVSHEVMETISPVLKKAMTQGMKVYFTGLDNAPHEKGVMFAGFALIEKSNIKGVMCFGNNDSIYNEKDIPFEDFL